MVTDCALSPLMRESKESNNAKYAVILYGAQACNLLDLEGGRVTIDFHVNADRLARPGPDAERGKHQSFEAIHLNSKLVHARWQPDLKTAFIVGEHDTAKPRALDFNSRPDYPCVILIKH